MEKETKFVIAKNIQKLRKEKGLTQIEFAEKINYSDKSVSKWERGEGLPDVETLLLIADLFSVSLDFLVGREEKSESRKKQEKFSKIALGCSAAIISAATLILIILDIISVRVNTWLVLLPALVVSAVVFTVFSGIEKSKKKLMFSASALLLFTVCFFSLLFSSAKILLILIPAEITLFLFFRLAK